MTAKDMEKVRLKKAVFFTWWCIRNGPGYKQYTKVRNQAKWECRKAQQKNPNAFYKNAQSKLKTRTGIAHLTREDGSLTTTDMEKANVLNNFSSSVFTRKDANNMPDTFTSRTYSELMGIQFTPGDIAKKLSKMNPNKSPGPDGAAPSIKGTTRNYS